MFFATIASFSEFESAQNGDRTFTAMSSKVAEIPLGGKLPVGYKLREKNIIVDSEQAEKVKIIFQKYLKIKKYSGVADYLNKNIIYTSQGKLWNHKSVKYVLSNPIYSGKVAWGKRKGRLRYPNPMDKWIIKDGQHEKIISVALYNRVQEIIHQR